MPLPIMPLPLFPPDLHALAHHGPAMLESSMPIACPIEFETLSAGDFNSLDRRVLHHAYASQNKLGRLYDECVYQTDLEARLEADGIRGVHTQVPVIVSHGEFVKRYLLDLVVENAALYDLKTVATFLGEHEAQMLNYILLVGLRRGKLLNFRSERVQGRLVATRLTPEERRRFTAAPSRWEVLTPECAMLWETILDLLADWGAFLEVSLYQEALTCFLGGESKVLRHTPVTRDGISLGNQRLHQHAAGVAFRVTAFTDGLDTHESHLRRLVAHTGLRAMQWINLCHAQATGVTIVRAEA